MAGVPDQGDIGEAEPYPGDASGHMNPLLTDFVGQHQTEEGQQWAGDAAGKVQDYLTARAVTQNAQDASDQLAIDLHNTKQGLVGLAQSDPGAIPLALDLAGHTVNGIVDQHPHMDPDDRAGVADALTSHMQSEIVHGGIQSLAEQDHAAAHAAIDKYGQYLPDDQQAALRTYADVQQGYRIQDSAAQQMQQQRDLAERGYHAATDYLHSLADPATGQFRAPDGFLQQLGADPTIAQTTRMALRAGYGMLNQYGDPPVSDPHLVSDLIGRMAGDVAPIRPGNPVGMVPGITGDVLDRMHENGVTGYSLPGGLPVGMGGAPGTPSNDNTVKQGEIFSHLGTALTVADAAFLNHLIAPANPQRRSDIGALADHLSDAQGTLMHPMNGAAGEQAYGRYVNWLIPAIASGANLGEIMATNPVQKFAPTVADYKAAIKRARVYG